MKFTDTVEIAGTRRTADGYLVGHAKVSRTGIQQYLGVEVGRPDLQMVNVYRPESTVFAKDSMASFVGKPITDNHPSESVNADNWGDHARGQIGEEVARDGEAVRISLALMDAALIKKVEDGVRELSVGYKSELVWGDGTAPDGTPYQATQTNIFVDHVAVVERGRAGPDFRIGDDANDSAKARNSWGIAPLILDEKKETKMVDLKTVVLGDKTAEVAVTDVAVLENFKTEQTKQLSDAKSVHDAAIAEKDKELATKDAEIADLKAKVLDEAAIDARVAAKSALVADAKAISAEIVTDGKTDLEIKTAAVVAVRGEDAVKDKSEAYIDAAFDWAVADANKVKPDNVRDALKTNVQTQNKANDNGQAAYEQRLTDGWKTKKEA